MDSKLLQCFSDPNYICEICAGKHPSPCNDESIEVTYEVCKACKHKDKCCVWAYTVSKEPK